MSGREARRPPIEPAYAWNGAPGLDGFHVFSLIVNKMIGTGVFTSPATVYLFTGNKSLALGLWGIGFVYSLLSMWMYLDYTAALPFTGGEIVYMSEMTAHSGKQEALYPEGGVPQRHQLSWRQRLGRRIFADGMLAYVTYAIIFVAVFNSATNSMQFGRMVLIFTVEAKKTEGTRAPEIDAHVARIIGAFALTLLCLFQLFFPRGGRGLNKFLALLKLSFVLGLIISGGVAAARRSRDPLERTDDWSKTHKDLTAAGFSKALISVLFSFQGWENATFVAGEIPYTKHRAMRKGFMTAVITVGVLYLLAAAVFLDAISWDQLNESKTSFYAPLYFDYSVPSQIGWAVVVSVSALGNLNSIIYTNSRVKQAIGQANILPWSKIWALDWDSKMVTGRADRPAVDNIGKHSPMGGLLLHWVVNMILVASSARIKDTLESISMPGYLQTYSHAFIQFILSLLFARLHVRKEALGLGRYISDGFRLYLAEKSWLCWPAIAVLSGFSMFMVVATGLRPYTGAFGGPEVFQGHNYPIILFSIVGIALLYYLFVFGIAERRYLTPRTTNLAPDEQALDSVLPDEPGPLAKPPLDKWNILRDWFHIQPIFWVDEWYADGGYNEAGTQQTVLVERVRRYGRRWRVVYVDDDYVLSNETRLQATQPIHFFYWFFGGRSAFPQNHYIHMRTRLWNRMSAWDWMPSFQRFRRSGKESNDDSSSNNHINNINNPASAGTPARSPAINGHMAEERARQGSHGTWHNHTRNTNPSRYEDGAPRRENREVEPVRSGVSTPSSGASMEVPRGAVRRGARVSSEEGDFEMEEMERRTGVSVS